MVLQKSVYYYNYFTTTDDDTDNDGNKDDIDDNYDVRGISYVLKIYTKTKFANTN